MPVEYKKVEVNLLVKKNLRSILSECMREAVSIEDLAERLTSAGVTFAPADNAECEIRNAELRVAGEFIEAVDEMMECVCAMTGLALTYYGRYPEVKKKYTEGGENGNTRKSNQNEKKN